MKLIKAAFVLGLLYCVQYTASAITTSNNNYRWRNDNGSQTTATNLAADNQAATLTSQTQKVRLRSGFNIASSTNTNNFPLTIYLYFLPPGGGSQTILTTTSSPFHLVSSSYIADKETTTNQFGESNFQGGDCLTQSTYGTNNPYTAGQGFEYEWSIQADNTVLNQSQYVFQYSLQGAVSPSMVLNVNIPVAVSITPSATGICNSSPSPVELNASAVANGTYVWSESPNNNTLAAQTANQNITVTPAVTTTYTVIATNGSTSATASQVIYQEMPIVLNTITASASTVCAGVPTVISTDNITNAIYTWTDGGTNSSITSGAGTYSITATPTLNTTYNVAVSNSCGSTSTTFDINVISTPAVSVNASANVICPGGSVTLTATGDPSTYAWDHSVTDGQSFSPVATTTYTVTATAGNNCTNTATQQVTVDNYTPPIVASSNPACMGSSVTLTAGGTNIIWSNSVSDGVSFPASGGVYTVTSTDANTCTGTASITLAVSPTFLYVNVNATGNNDGTSWANAYTNLNTALAAVASCAAPEIWVAKGTYKPSAYPAGCSNCSGSRDYSFGIKQATVYGGFSGNETAASQRNAKNNITILSGDIGTLGDNSDNVYHVLMGVGTGTFTVDGFTITGGNANGGSTATVNGKNFNRNFGGGATVLNQSVNIQNCIFSQNNASSWAGALNIQNGTSSTINGSVFTKNTCSSYGGAIYQQNGTVTATGCVFVENTATTKGGALYNNSGVFNLYSSTLYNNTSADGGFYTSTNATGNIYNSILSLSPVTFGIIIPTTPGVVNVYNSDLQEGNVSGTTNQGGEIQLDPLFVNSSDPDGADNVYGTVDDGIALKNSSPCLNTGNNTYVSTIPLDITGATRIYQSTVDMGVYEGCSSPVITINVTGNSTFCKGGSVTLDASGTLGGTNLTWTETGSDNTLTGQTSLAQVLVAPTVTTTYSASESNVCGTRVNYQVVTIENAITPAISSSVNGVCGSGSVTVSTPAITGATYNWSSTGASILSGQGTTSISSNPGATSTYAVTISNSCGSVNTSKVITSDSPFNGTITSTYNYTGASQTFTVPAGVTSIDADVMGSQGAVNGGNGGKVHATIAVTPLSTLTLYVGSSAGNSGAPYAAGTAGSAGSYSTGGNGGSASSVYLNSTALVIGAGGGGGGGMGEMAGPGGSGSPGGQGGTSGNPSGNGGTGGSTGIPMGPPMNMTMPGISGTGGAGGVSSVDPSITGALYTDGFQSGNGQIIISYAVQSNLSITGTSTICKNASTTLSVNLGTSYLWAESGSANTLNGQSTQVSVSVSPTTTTTYTVSVSNACQTIYTSQVVTVNSCNNNPIVNAPLNQVICENGATSALAFTVSDADNDPVSVTGSSSNTVLLPNANIVIAGSGANRTVTLTPFAGKSGNATITLLGDDGQGGTITSTFDLTVNSAPSVSFGPTPPPICIGSSRNIVFSGTNSATVGYKINGGPSQTLSLNGSGTATLTVTPAVTSSYSVFYILDNSTQCSASSGPTRIVVVNNLPTVSGTSTYICSSGSITLGATASAGTVTWFDAASAGNVVATGTSYTNSNLTVTTTYFVEASANGCISAARTPVIATLYPALSASVNTPSIICNAYTTDLTVTANGGSGNYQYNWSNNTSANSINVGVGMYDVTITDANCGNSTFSRTITERTAIPAVISGKSNFCNGSSTPLTASGGASYVWIGGSTNQNLNVNTPGLYSVTVTDINACTIGVSKTISMYPAFSASINTPPVVCKGTNTDLLITPSGGSGTYSYNWNAGSPSNTNTINVGAGNYSATVSDLECGNIVFTPSVSELPSLVADLKALTTTTFCEGGNVSLLASGGASYLWNDNSTSPLLTVTQGGTYSVVVTNSCESASTSIVVVVNPLPAPQISAGGPTTFCLGGQVVLTASGGTSYKWSNGSVNNAITLTSGGLYTVTVTNGCGSLLTTQQVTVNTAPVPSILADGPLTFCKGGNVNLTASGGTSYNWSTGGTGATIAATASDIYTVTVSNACGSQTASQPVIVNQLPVVSITSSNSAILCQGVSTSLTATGGNTYKWDNGVTGSIQNVSPAASDRFMVTATDLNGCSDTSSILIVVIPSVVTISPAGPISLCEGDTLSLQASLGITYQWSNGSTVNHTTIKKSGIYGVTITTAGGCKAESDLVSVTVNPKPAKPNIDFINDTMISSVAVSYQWYFNGQVIPSAVQRTYVYGSNLGFYQVKISDINTCSAISDSLGIFSGVSNVNLAKDVKAYPNPFTTDITVEYSLTRTGGVSIELVDITGKVLEVLKNEQQQAGVQHVIINGDQLNLSAGMYFIQLKTAGATQLIKVNRIK